MREGGRCSYCGLDIALGEPAVRVNMGEIGISPKRFEPAFLAYKEDEILHPDCLFQWLESKALGG